MSEPRLRLSDEELQATENDLRAALTALRESFGSNNPAEPLLRGAIDIGLDLIAAVRTERKMIQYPVMNAMEDENTALREENLQLRDLAEALIPVARVAEGVWGDIANGGSSFREMNYRHHVMSKLGGALRRFHVAMNGAERRTIGQFRHVA